MSASLEHELAPNLAVRGLYVLKHDRRRLRHHQRAAALQRVQHSDHAHRSRPRRRARHRATTAGTVTIYDYDPAYRGSNFVGNQAVNRPDGRSDYYNSLEGSITRRLADSWSLLAAYTATKYHRWLVEHPAESERRLLRSRRLVALELQAERQLQLPEGLLGRRDRRGPSTAPSASAPTCSAPPIRAARRCGSWRSDHSARAVRRAPEAAQTHVQRARRPSCSRSAASG